MNISKYSYRKLDYRFNGKELDLETGNYYYGARYYDPKISVWLSVDPMAADFPHLTTYNFTENNPIMLVDPDGRSAICPDCPDQGFEIEKNNQTKFYTYDKQTGKPKFAFNIPTPQGEFSREPEYDIETYHDPNLGGNNNDEENQSGIDIYDHNQAGANIYGEGGSSAGSWNSDLPVVFELDVTTPFWSVFFGGFFGIRKLSPKKGVEASLPDGVKDGARAVKRVSDNVSRPNSIEFQPSSPEDCVHCNPPDGVPYNHGGHEKRKK